MKVMKKEIPEVLVWLLMSLYDGAKSTVREESELPEVFEVKVWMNQGPMLSGILFAVVVDNELAIEGVSSELLYTDDIVLLSERIVGHRNKFRKWKEAYENYGLKVNHRKRPVMVSGGITNDGLNKGKVYLCDVLNFLIKANSVLCEECGKFIHRRCDGVRSLTKSITET